MTDIDITLTPIEARVLGSLLEKELATPEYYPLSLNALTNACNQKSNRFPVLTLSEEEISRALKSLQEKQIVCRSESGRVAKYWHNFTKRYNLITREAALLCLLLLRGQQTAGELRTRSDRLCSFETLEEVAQSLDSLAEIGLVRQLARQPGQKEQRYMHLLAGEPDAGGHLDNGGGPTTGAAGTADDRMTELEHSVAWLQEELEAVKMELQTLKDKIGS